MNLAFRGGGDPISCSGLRDAFVRLDCEQASLWALLTVETRGFGFLPDRRPKILFERHVFHRLTDGRFDSCPDLSSATPGAYEGGAAEYERLDRAAALHEDAALRSASWGLGQIMGFNATRLRYPNVRAMIAAFVTSEDGQLDGVCRFIEDSAALHGALRRHDWNKLAFHYNGGAYAKNEYDARLRHAYERFGRHGCPDVDVRAAQAYLAYLGFDPQGIDGAKGPHTLNALHRFQRQAGLPVDDVVDANTVDTLRQAFAAKRR